MRNWTADSFSTVIGRNGITYNNMDEVWFGMTIANELKSSLDHDHGFVIRVTLQDSQHGEIFLGTLDMSTFLRLTNLQNFKTTQVVFRNK